VHVACGGDHTVCVLERGVAMAWGDGGKGATGLNSTENQVSPK
jgi:alpha-tubulin suppressor-like RCC1 family protein